MKRLLFIFIGFMIILTGCRSKVIEHNGKVEYAHISMAIDETDMYIYAGSSDYIFIGTVESVLNEKVNYDSPYSSYSIKVDENLKGNLKSKIQCDKAGGYMKDGTLLLYESDNLRDSGLPKVGKQYVFMAYAQEDGRLLITELNGNIEYAGKDMKKSYLDYINNEIENDRQRFISKYDIHYNKTSSN